MSAGSKRSTPLAATPTTGQARRAIQTRTTHELRKLRGVIEADHDLDPRAACVHDEHDAVDVAMRFRARIDRAIAARLHAFAANAARS